MDDSKHLITPPMNIFVSCFAFDELREERTERGKEFLEIGINFEICDRLKKKKTCFLKN